MLKLDILFVRKSGMTHDECVEYWRGHHAAFFTSQPIVKKTVRRYVQSRTIPNAPESAQLAEFDGNAQLWFDNLDGFFEYIQSDNYKDIIQKDEIKFADPEKVKLLFSTETTIF